MSAWPGKYIIGLTGNIATGKSVARKMLEHLGAYGIDADALAHRAIAQGAPGYQPVVDLFGKYILAADGQIDRARLGKIVFNDPEALGRLEAVIHPMVSQAVDLLIRRATQKVIVVEAIKLLESSLYAGCDSIWVTHAMQEIQLARLMQKRGMDAATARQRIAAQPAQQAKLAAANVAIRNDGSFEDMWRQVSTAWQKIGPEVETGPARPRVVRGALVIERARPRQAADIAALVTRLSGGARRPGVQDIMAAFGEKAYLLLNQDGRTVGLVGWQVENLVARVDEIYLDAQAAPEQALKALMEGVESASRELQCEAALLFLSPELARRSEIWSALGYQERSIESLKVRAWEEAARESMPAGTVMLFRQLRQDRVLRPV